ncbi:MAG: aldo/keto reductase [Candidatus Hydrogenedentota bacterium]
MQYRTLGNSDLKVSIYAFGAWQLGDSTYWGEKATTDAEAVVQSAIDAGVNLFDTAESYGNGNSERVLGKALGTRRKDVSIATKVSPNHLLPSEKLREACEASLKRLGTDVIDLYQVHWPCDPAQFDDAAATMVRLKDEGKIRAIGVSNFGSQHLDAWIKSGKCHSNQLGYNLLFRAIEYEIVPACQKHGVGILVYMPIMQGILAGRWKTVDEMPEARRRTRHFSSERPGTRHGEPGCEDLLMDTLRQLNVLCEEIGQPMARVAIAWLMQQPGVTSVIVGGRTPAQLERNLAAADLELDDAVLARLNAITDPLKERLGTNPDMWCGEKDRRIF